jgi:hypothetical protein
MPNEQTVRSGFWVFLLCAPLALLSACGSSSQTVSGTGGSTAGSGGAAGGSIGAGGGGGKATGGAVAEGGSKGGASVAGQGGAGGSASGGGAGAGGRGGNGGSGVGGTGAGGAPSCATAISGAACTSEGMTCGGPCTDICQFCNLLRCTGGHWQGIEAAPAPCFTCGTGKCQTLKQYCNTTQGGPVGAQPSYACLELPTACLSTRTCTCLAQNSVPGQCTMSSNGELMTLLQAP